MKNLVIALAIICFAAPAMATTYDDVTIVGDAAPVAVCGSTTNPKRLRATVMNKGATNNLQVCDDTSCSATHGITLAPDTSGKAQGGSYTTLSQQPIYVFSHSGTTVGCIEEVR